MNFDPTITIGALLQTAGLLVAALGLIFNALVTRRAARERRIQQLVDLQRQFYSDESMVDAYYLIQYGRFTYDAAFHGSDLEKQIDRLLVHFENIASLFEAKVVSIAELDIIAHRYLVIYQNPEIQRYFEWLDSLYKERGIEARLFDTFRKVGAIVEKRRNRFLPT